jgi:DNA repair protein RadA/Sms
MEGSRVYFTEIQALVQKSQYGFAKRNAVGYDLNRLQMMAAIISRHTKIDLTEFDIFLNTANGYRLRDPIADLAVLMALASSAIQKPLSGAMIALGEVDLAGRVHLTESAKKIIKTAQKIGYKIANPSGEISSIINKYL